MIFLSIIDIMNNLVFESDKIKYIFTRYNQICSKIFTDKNMTMNKINYFFTELDDINKIIESSMLSRVDLLKVKMSNMKEEIKKRVANMRTIGELQEHVDNSFQRDILNNMKRDIYLSDYEKKHRLRCHGN